jgi:hypothetical protein
VAEIKERREPGDEPAVKTDAEKLREMKNKLGILIANNQKLVGPKRTAIRGRIINATTLNELIDIEIELNEEA